MNDEHDYETEDSERRARIRNAVTSELWGIAARTGTTIFGRGLDFPEVDGIITGPRWFIQLAEQVTDNVCYRAVEMRYTLDESRAASVAIIEGTIQKYGQDAIDAAYTLGQDRALEAMLEAYEKSA